VEPLSLLFLNPLGEEDWGGVETWMLAAARGLAERGHRVAACARRSSRFLDRFSAEGFETESLAFRRDFGPLDVMRLRRILRRRRIDAAVTKLDRGIRVAGLSSAIGGGAAVVQRQGLFEVEDGIRHRFAFRWVDRIVTPAGVILDRIVESGAFPVERIDHLPNGVDADRFKPDSDRGRAFREMNGLPAGPLLVSTSRLHEQKGHDLAVRALADLPGEARLALAGAGKCEAGIRERARELGVADRVRLLGHVDEIPDLLCAADAFVLASRFEGMPNSVLEAMAAGLPIVATAVGDVPRMLEDGVSGLLVPPEDGRALAGALARVLDDADLARALGRAARASAVERHPIDAMVVATETCLRRAVEHRRGLQGRGA